MIRVLLIISLISFPIYAAEGINFITIDNLIEGLNLEKAAQMIDKLEDTPEKILYLRGKLAFFMGDYESANKFLSGLSEKDYLVRCAINAYNLTRNYKRYETEHFIILYPDERDEIYLEYLGAGLEEGLRTLSPIFGFRLERKIRVEILQDQFDLEKLTTLPKEAIEKTNTIAVTKFNKIMLSSPETQLEGYDYVNTAIHELIHFMISTLTNERTPVWIHESLARYFDHYSNKRLPDLRPDALALLKKRYEKRNLITFQQIHPSMALLPSQEDTAVAFSEVFLVSEFLLKRLGEGFVKELLKMLKEHNDMDEIFSHFGFGSFSAFEKEFFKYMGKRLEKITTTEHLYYDRTIKKGKRSEYLGDAVAMKYVKLGDLLFLEKLFYAAFIEYDKASKYGVLNPHIENRKAFALLNAGKFNEAVSVLEKIQEIYPDYYSTFVNLARANISLKNYSKATDALERAVRINPFDKELYLMYQKIFTERKNQFELDKTKRKLEILQKRHN
ncbi:MAG: tetratricopeptide repeat protein [Myxococcota bacterium]